MVYQTYCGYSGTSGGRHMFSHKEDGDESFSLVYHYQGVRLLKH